MITDRVDRVKLLMASILAPRLEPPVTAFDLHDDMDLRDQGIVDSLGFVQLIGELEVQLGSEIDLSNLDPEQLTNVGALTRHIAESVLVHER